MRATPANGIPVRRRSRRSARPAATPKCPTTTGSLGRKYGCIDDLEAALDCFQRAVKLDPKHATSLAFRDGVVAALAVRKVVQATETAEPALARLRGRRERFARRRGTLRLLLQPPRCRRQGYRLELESGRVYVLAIAAKFDAIVRLERDDFSVVSSNSDARTDSRRTRFTFTVPAGGTYRIVVTSAKRNETGEYTLKGSSMPADSAKTITHHGELTRTDETAYTRYRDNFPLKLAANQTIVVTVRSPMSDARLQVFEHEEGNKVLESSRHPSVRLALDPHRIHRAEGGPVHCQRHVGGEGQNRAVHAHDRDAAGALFTSREITAVQFWLKADG